MFQGQTFQPGTIFGENKVGGRLVEQGGMLSNEPPQIRTRGPESLAAQEQYIPVPPGQPVGIATNGMPVPQTFGPYVGNAGGFGNKGGQARQMGYAPMRQGLGGFF